MRQNRQEFSYRNPLRFPELLCGPTPGTLEWKRQTFAASPCFGTPKGSGTAHELCCKPDIKGFYVFVWICEWITYSFQNCMTNSIWKHLWLWFCCFLWFIFINLKAPISCLLSVIQFRLINFELLIFRQILKLSF